MAAASILVKKLHPQAVVPRRATPSASGFDLHACIDDGPIVVSQRPVAIPTGVAIEAAPGMDVQIRPRSGLAKNGILCTLGTVDADYRGELLVTMYSLAPDITHEVQHGDRIAQLVVGRLSDVEFVEASSLGESARGAGGHGSTGR